MVPFTASVFLCNNGSPSFLREASVVFWKAAIRLFPHIHLVRIPPDPNLLNLIYLIKTKNQVKVSLSTLI